MVGVGWDSDPASQQCLVLATLHLGGGFSESGWVAEEEEEEAEEVEAGWEDLLHF